MTYLWGGGGGGTLPSNGGRGRANFPIKSIFFQSGKTISYRPYHNNAPEPSKRQFFCTFCRILMYVTHGAHYALDQSSHTKLWPRGNEHPLTLTRCPIHFTIIKSEFPPLTLWTVEISSVGQVWILQACYHTITSVRRAFLQEITFTCYFVV